MIILCLLAGLFSHFILCHGYPNLLYATSKEIRIVSGNKGGKGGKTETMLVQELTEGYALDYCYSTGLLCWTDMNQETIQCATFDGSQVVSKVSIVKTQLISPEGIACDWVTQKLYWTDGGTNRIEVVSLTDKHRKVLFWEDIDQPRAIALVPMKSIMFWTEWGDVPKIERSGMDGSNGSRKVIVSEDIFWPNGLSIDYENEMIYWVDGKLKFIAMVDYDGRKRRKVLTSGMEYPYSMAFYHNRLYWTDWTTWFIYELDRNNVNATAKKIVHSEVGVTDVRVYEPERQPSMVTPCQHNNGGCSHLCLLSPTEQGYQCACPTGVKLLDRYNCANGSQEFLIVVQRTDVCKISLDSPDYTIFKLPLQGVQHAIAIDYDPVQDFIYWTDDGNQGIRRAALRGGQQEDVVVTEVQHPDGVAVDWISRNLFWTDTGTDRIEVARLNGQYRKVLINKDLREPRGIAVAPVQGLVFWSDWNEERPMIERANMDGSDRRLLVDSDLGWPNGIVLDLVKERIYWCDAKTDRIESSKFDGSDRREVISDNLSHPFGLSLLGDFLYWSDWSQRSIDRVNRFTSTERHMIADQIANIMGLKAVKIGDPAYRGWNPCANNNGGCNHLCLNRPGNNYTCACQMGHELTSDLKTCVLPEAFLLFARKETIGRISIENKNNDIPIPVTGVKSASGLDFDKNDGRIYWTDTKLKTITRAFINGSDMERVVSFGLESPRSVAVDWVSHNLYWVDTETKRIEVARMNGSSRTVLLWKDMLEPGSVTVDPVRGYMYWSDWHGSGVIYRARMDGSERTTLVTNATRASGLTIDYRMRRLYWTTSKPAIERCNLDGTDRRTIVSQRLTQPSALSQYQDYIYWTDSATGIIEQANKTTGGERREIHTGLRDISDMVVFHDGRQDGWNQCAMGNAGCSHLCLPLPDRNYTCHCPLHHTLGKDGKTCLPPRAYLLFSERGVVHRLLPDTDDCPDMILPMQNLKNMRAIEFDPVAQVFYWIDGRYQSIKRSSESDSKISTVVSSVDKNFHPYDLALDPYTRLLYWSCANNDVINVTRLDRSMPLVPYTVLRNASHKPRALALHPEKGLLFWTDLATKHRLMRSRLDGSDKVLLVGELKDLTAVTVDRVDNVVYFAFSKQIDSCDLDGRNRKERVVSDVDPISLAVQGHLLYWIDKERHSVMRVHKYAGHDKTDVMSTGHPLTDLVAVRILTQSMMQAQPCSPLHKPPCSLICLPHVELPQPADASTHFNTSQYVSAYMSDQLAGVDTGKLVSERYVMTHGSRGNYQCRCPLNQMLLPDDRTCSDAPVCGAGHFSCLGLKRSNNKDCIPAEWHCDGQADCPDGSDETGCPNCGPTKFHCLSGQCIDLEFVCDRQNQCPDGSDEAKCCKPGEFQCVASGNCIPETEVCDRWANCDDNSDESAARCATHGIAAVPFPDKGVSNYVLGTAIFALCVIVLASLVYYYKRKVAVARDVSGDSSGDPLAPKPFVSTAAPKPRLQDGVRMSVLNGSTTSNSYDRNHITGASSSSTSNGVCSGAGMYPAETLNPPPSPATTADSRRCCSNLGSRYRPYRHYRSINQPPPPTPCSTDVCDESDYGYRPQTESEYMSYSRGTASECDSDPFPPPPTPSSCPPSPSSAYFSPLPPPPSPETGLTTKPLLSSSRRPSYHHSQYS